MCSANAAGTHAAATDDDDGDGRSAGFLYCLRVSVVAGVCVCIEKTQFLELFLSFANVSINVLLLHYVLFQISNTNKQKLKID